MKFLEFESQTHLVELEEEQSQSQHTSNQLQMLQNQG